MNLTHSLSGSPITAALPRHERDAAIVARRAEGASLQAVATEFDITRERVRQIVAEQGGPSRREVKRIRAAQAEAEREALRDRCLDHLEAHPGLSLEELAQSLAADHAAVRAALGPGLRRLLAPRPRRVAVCVSEDELLGELRLAGGLLKGPLTGTAYERIARALGLHSRATHIHRFGTWATACERAGVTPGQPRRGRYVRRWSPGDMLDWVARYLAEPGSPGTYAGYADFARSIPDAPSAETVRVTFGTWSTIKAEALRHGVGPEPTSDGWIASWEDLTIFSDAGLDRLPVLAA